MHRLVMSPCCARPAGQLAALLFFAMLAVACGEESLPGNEALDAREALGLEPAHVAAMSTPERAQLVRVLTEAWPEPGAAAQLVEHQVDGEPLTGELPDAPALMGRIRDLDAQRHAAQLHPMLLGALDAPATLALEIPLPLSHTLETAESGLWQLADGLDAPSSAAFTGYIVWDDAWGGVEQPALGGISEREAVRDLEPLVRHVLGQLAPGDGSVRVVPAPQAPLLVWYASANRAVLINPTLLYLLDHDGAAQTHSLQRQPTATRALEQDEASTPGSGYEHDVPQGIDAPPHLDGLGADGSGGSTCDWDPCGNAASDCGDSVEDILLIIGLVILGLAVIAGIVLLIIFV